MKKKYISILLTVILILSGCESEGNQPAPDHLQAPSQTDSAKHEETSECREEGPEFPAESSLHQTDPTILPEVTGSENSKPSEEKQPTESAPTHTEPPKETVPAQTQPPKETVPTETQPTQTIPPETAPPETTVPPSEPDQSEPAVTEITYEFKRQVASYAAQYINAYRGSPCTVLSGMSQVAQYRASQLTWNYGHSTSDKRAALAYYEYGRFIDATEFGDDASNSYWEADSAEAICAGFYGTDPEAMGKRIADLIRNSSGHWSYISSSEYSYIGIGVEYREGSEYGWYCCVMVGSVDYG